MGVTGKMWITDTEMPPCMVYICNYINININLSILISISTPTSSNVRWSIRAPGSIMSNAFSIAWTLTTCRYVGNFWVCSLRWSLYPRQVLLSPVPIEENREAQRGLRSSTVGDLSIIWTQFHPRAHGCPCYAISIPWDVFHWTTECGEEWVLGERFVVVCSWVTPLSAHAPDAFVFHHII